MSSKMKNSDGEIDNNTLRVVVGIRLTAQGNLEQKTVEIHLKSYGLIGINPRWELVPDEPKVSEELCQN